MMQPLTLAQLNAAPPDVAVAMLDGVYEHSPWIAREALPWRPFQSLAQLKHRLASVVSASGQAAQLQLLRAHPELAGKAMVDQRLTAESSHEQRSAGLTQCTPAEFERIQQLNRDYNARFGFPFILAVRGPRGSGLSKAEILATFARRLQGHPEFELQECLRNVHRIAEIRLNDKFGLQPTLGQQVWDWQQALARHSDAAAQGQLTVTYLTEAHQACARQIAQDMREAGCDRVHTDAVGNVVGRYFGLKAGLRCVMTGSHYDTVRNAGKYDGRLGIYVPLACVKTLHQLRLRLPFDLEIVAFSEEEGQRFPVTFLGSSALTGDFQPAWLDQCDADGVRLGQALQQAGLDASAIAALQRRAEDYLGFIEVHIEQGPVLNELNLPLGIVTSINASVRYQCEIVGTASHAGTTPMNRRRDAAAAVAELRRGGRGRHHRPIAGAGRLRQCGARPLPVFTRPARAQRCPARRTGARCAEKAGTAVPDAPAPVQPAADPEGQRRAQRPGLAGTLGSRRQRPRPAAAAPAQRCRP